MVVQPLERRWRLLTEFCVGLPAIVFEPGGNFTAIVFLPIDAFAVL